MVIVHYHPPNTKFLSRTFLESLYIFPSYIYGITIRDFSNIQDLKYFIGEFITSVYNNKYTLTNDIILNNIRLYYITNTNNTINHIINNKIKYNFTLYPSNNVYNENYNININTFILSDNYNSSIVNKISQYKFIIVINTNYGNNNNYDIISIYFIIFRHTSTFEKAIFNNKTINLNFLNIR